MMLSAVYLATMVVMVMMLMMMVVASTEDCPLHCPPVESPVCGTGENCAGQTVSHITDQNMVFR